MKSTQLIELTNIDNGVTRILTYKKCVEMFGKDEFTEMLMGYSPNWVAVEVN